LAIAGSLGQAGEPNEATHRPLSATWCADRCDAVITDWSLAAFQVIKAADGYQDPMAAARSLAMMHVAMHDAANAVRPRYRRYALAAPPSSGSKADAAVAAATAAHDVLAALYPRPKDTALLKAELAKTLLEAGVGPAIERAPVQSLGATGHLQSVAVISASVYERLVMAGQQPSAEGLKSTLSSRWIVQKVDIHKRKSRRSTPCFSSRPLGAR
jgi:hypothetical protein